MKHLTNGMKYLIISGVLFLLFLFLIIIAHHSHQCGSTGKVQKIEHAVDSYKNSVLVIICTNGVTYSERP